MNKPNADPVWARLEEIEHAETIDSLRDTFITTISAFGFDAAYFLAPVVADPRVGRELTNFGFSAEWEQRYRSSDYLDDPLPGLALANGSTLQWPQQIECEHVSKGGKAFLDRLSKNGKVGGIAIPCYGPFARCGFVALRMPHPSGMQDLANIVKAEVVTRTAFRRYVFIERPFKEDYPGLSAREAQVLHWIAAGKSSTSIGHIIGLSPASVNEYVRRIFAKLDVNDRTSASVQALALGLIIAGDYPGRQAPSPDV